AYCAGFSTRSGTLCAATAAFRAPVTSWAFILAAAGTCFANAAAGVRSASIAIVPPAARHTERRLSLNPATLARRDLARPKRRPCANHVLGKGIGRDLRSIVSQPVLHACPHGFRLA